MLKNYEKEVLKLLVSGTLPPQRLNDVLQHDGSFDYEFTGSGYYLSIRNLNLPKERIVCSKPILFGEADGIVCGFVVFIENGKLTLECHSWGEIEIPEDFRIRDVKVKAASPSNTN